MSMPVRLVCALLLLEVGLGAAAAGETTSQPYFVSIKDGIAYMREGPGENYRIKWIYHRKNLPMEVTAVFEGWRRVKDMDGEVGWIHEALLSRERTALILGRRDVAVRRTADAASDVVAQAEPGVIGRLVGCTASSCEMRFEGSRGWVDRDRLWGVLPGEKF